MFIDWFLIRDWFLSNVCFTFKLDIFSAFKKETFHGCIVCLSYYTNKYLKSNIYFQVFFKYLAMYITRIWFIINNEMVARLTTERPIIKYIRWIGKLQCHFDCKWRVTFINTYKYFISKRIRAPQTAYDVNTLVNSGPEYDYQRLLKIWLRP